MATKTKSESKPKAKKVVKKESPAITGKIQGEYSTSVYNNGELISFDIDWDKLREHMKKVG
jgi:hypothetical protein